MVLPVGLAAFSVGWRSGYDSGFRRDFHISYVKAVFSYVDFFFSYVDPGDDAPLRNVFYVTFDSS